MIFFFCTSRLIIYFTLRNHEQFAGHGVENGHGLANSARARSVIVFVMSVAVVSVVAAALIPHLSLFVSTLGAVSGTFLALIFPPLCHMSATTAAAAASDRYRWRMLANGVTLTLGVIAFVSGTYASFSEIRAALGDETVATTVNITTQTIP